MITFPGHQIIRLAPTSLEEVIARATLITPDRSQEPGFPLKYETELITSIDKFNILKGPLKTSKFSLTAKGCHWQTL